MSISTYFRPNIHQNGPKILGVNNFCSNKIILGAFYLLTSNILLVVGQKYAILDVVGETIFLKKLTVKTKKTTIGSKVFFVGHQLQEVTTPHSINL
jgi:hypothetical protein